MNKNSLSVVAVVRNDGYGMYYEQRLISFFKSIKECVYDLELVLVEWNPPKDTISFYEQFKHIIPSNKKVKIVTVPPEIHFKLENSQHFNVFEYWAKNVGARHCSHEYILFTNPDNIFHSLLWNELFENLNEGTFIRAPRVDVSYVDIDYNNLSVDGLLNNLPVKWAFMYDGNGLFAAASGDFLCVSKKAVESVKGYDEFFTFSHMDTKILWKLHHSGMVQKVLNNTTFHIDHLRPNCEVASNNSLWTSDFHTHTYNDNWGLFNEVLEVKIYN